MIICCQELGKEKRYLLILRTEGNFWSDGHILYQDYSGGYKTLYSILAPMSHNI